MNSDLAGYQMFVDLEKSTYVNGVLKDKRKNFLIEVRTILTDPHISAQSFGVLKMEWLDELSMDFLISVIKVNL